ncbi:kinase-like protein, partial [Coniochaeta ligniaria NRRL 30616]
MTTEQYHKLIEEELEHTWILNLSMHFRDKSKREKLYFTYLQTPSQWRRVTISLDYRKYPANSLEADLSHLRFQRDKSATIYEAIRESLQDIQFYDTVTNLRLQTEDGRLHVHVVEDINEIINYPSLDLFQSIPCRHIAADAIKLDSHISGFVYKVNVNGQVLARKDIAKPEGVVNFVDQIRTLAQLHIFRFVIDLYGVVLSQDKKRVTGYLMPYCEGGALVDVIYDNDGKLPWPRRAKWARQIVIGLSQIHESGTIHGNLTLSKIALDDDDDISILGLGAQGMSVGWAPPEAELLIQSNQSVTLVQSMKSDIYQLGMVLWALASQTDEPESCVKPLQVTKEMGVPAWYKHIVEACLSLDPQQRPHTTSLLDMW